MTQYSVLLLFKDNLSIGGKDEFPITIKSYTIKKHLLALKGSDASNKKKEQYLLQFEDSEKSVLRRVEANAIVDGNFVWGWWKKPGESHNTLFKIIKEACKEEGFINALLFNRYMRRIYTAEITDIYYVPYASTVTIPNIWASKCPDYYKDLPHFCGAYFSMKLKVESKDATYNSLQNNTNINETKEYESYMKNQKIQYEDPQIVLKRYFVDKNTFDEIFLNDLSVIRQPEGVIDASKNIVDKEIKPLSLKLTDQTIFLLRKSTHKKIIRELFDNQDPDINNEIKNLPTSDAVEFIKSMTRKDWEKLFSLKDTIIAISDLFRDRGMPITSIDIKLVSNLIMERILVLHDGFSVELSATENCIVDWLLSSDFKTQRENASGFFSLAWIHSIKNIDMLPLDDYFKILPQLEEISSSTKHIKNKLYRDHLNHNIRSALMASYLVYVISHNYEDMRLAFFSGLLHDIAHPLSSYDGTIQSIQESFIKLDITKLTSSNSIVNRNNLKNWVNTIAFISSIPNIKDKEIPQPFDDLDDLFKNINPKLLYEEIMCSMDYDHSFLSAVVVLNMAAKKVSHNVNDYYNDGVKRLFADQTEYKDLFQIIQCIALHDRKASIGYRGLSKSQQITMIGMDDYFLPVITIIADEIQEWGRPISSNENPIVNDCDINYSDKMLIIKYTCNFKKEILKETKYCFLEHFHSKIRMFSRLKNKENSVIKLQLEIDIVEGLKIHTGSNYSSSLKLNLEENDIIWPLNSELFNQIPEENDKRLIAFISYPSDKTNIISSFIAFDSSQKDVIGMLKSNFYLNALKINKITLLENLCRMTINDDIIIEGRINTYYFTKYQNLSIVQKFDNYEILENIGVLYLKDVSINKYEKIGTNHIQISANDLHLKPQPHFLDLDWRFNYQSINSILNFVSANTDNEKVCYLGCPSLALYHSRQINNMKAKFTLFDKGHFALDKWIQEGHIDKNNFVEYNVYSKIPDEYLHKYDIIIMDPPWYKDFYTIFLKRAIAFVRNSGIIGIVEYPGYPGHKEKIDEFKLIRSKLFNRYSSFFPYCSIEVAYAEPDFEKSWQGHKKFVHSAIDTYRPAYMDFYLINNAEYINNEEEETPSIYYDNKNLIDIEYTKGNGYVRLKKGFEKYFDEDAHWIFKTRKSLKRIRSEKIPWIGWSTKNTIIRIDTKKGNIIKNEKELIDNLTEYESCL